MRPSATVACARARRRASARDMSRRRVRRSVASYKLKLQIQPLIRAHSSAYDSSALSPANVFLPFAGTGSSFTGIVAVTIRRVVRVRVLVKRHARLRSTPTLAVLERVVEKYPSRFDSSLARVASSPLPRRASVLDNTPRTSRNLDSTARSRRTRRTRTAPPSSSSSSTR